VRALSTLDTYALTIVFDWLSHYPYLQNECPLESSVTLPPDLQYEYLPILYSELPPPSQNPPPIRVLLEFIIGLILSNLGIIILLLLIASLIALLMVFGRGKSSEDSQFLSYFPI